MLGFIIVLIMLACIFFVISKISHTTEYKSGIQNKLDNFGEISHSEFKNLCSYFDKNTGDITFEEFGEFLASEFGINFLAKHLNNEKNIMISGLFTDATKCNLDSEIFGKELVILYLFISSAVISRNCTKQNKRDIILNSFFKKTYELLEKSGFENLQEFEKEMNQRFKDYYRVPFLDKNITSDLSDCFINRLFSNEKIESVEQILLLTRIKGYVAIRAKIFNDDVKSLKNSIKGQLVYKDKGVNQYE